MKNSILLLLLTFCQLGFSQDKKTQTVSNYDEVDNSLYLAAGVEYKPEFPGGIEKFYKYIRKNFRPPKERSFKGGRMIVQFVIEKDGTVTEIKVMKDLEFGTKEEAIRVLTKCPKWKPAEQQGRKVRCSFTLPITLQSN